MLIYHLRFRIVMNQECRLDPRRKKRESKRRLLCYLIQANNALALTSYIQSMRSAFIIAKKIRLQNEEGVL